jgi:hypothetical protein
MNCRTPQGEYLRTNKEVEGWRATTDCRVYGFKATEELNGAPRGVENAV